jgi:uncharacterized protein involved in copper resistance
VRLRPHEQVDFSELNDEEERNDRTLGIRLDYGLKKSIEPLVAIHTQAVSINNPESGSFL